MLVSVIVPVYNSKDTIRECYLSLINQSYKELEIIFVNDGSKDNSLEILESFTDKRVKVISQENGGPGKARRTGLEAATGEYITFVDSDDTIETNYILKLVKTLSETKTNMCIGRIGVHTYYPIIKYITLKSKKKPRKIELDKKREYLPSIPPGMVGKMYLREYIKLKKIDFLANEDLALIYPLCANANKISFCNEAVYHYYLSKNSQYRTYLLGYKYDNLINTFGPLKVVYDEFEKVNKLEDYFYEVEMLFIKNISERVNNICDSVSDKIYRTKFISAILDYLEFFFPDWEKNPYYVRNYPLGEVTDKYRMHKFRKEVKKIKRKRIYISLEEIYERYKQVEKMYEQSRK